MKIKLKNITNGALFLLLFLASMNLASKFYYFVFVSFFLFVISKKSLRMDNCSLLYLMLCTLMAGYHYSEDIFDIIKYFSYAFFYLIGYNVTHDSCNFDVCQEESRNISLKNSNIMLIVMAFGSFAHYVLNWISNVGADVGRNTHDIWTGKEMAATGQASLSCLMLGLSVAWILASRKKIGRIFGILLLLSIMAYNLVLAGRTLIIIFFIIFTIGLIFYLVNVGEFKKRVMTVLLIIGLVALIAVLYFRNVGGVREMVENSNLFSRFSDISKGEALETERGDRKLSFLKNMVKYPFGGLHMREEFSYAHDLLLDGYDEYGVICLVLLIGILYTGIRELFCFCFDKANDMIYKISFLCVYIAILLFFCVEPIFPGMPWLFACYCLINGSLAGINRGAVLMEKYQKTEEDLQGETV